MAALFLSLSPWLGGSGLLAQDPVSLTPDVASRLSPALRTVLPAMSPGQRLPVIVQFVAPAPAPAEGTRERVLQLVVTRGPVSAAEIGRELELTAGAMSPGGEWVATASASGAITLWDIVDPLNPKPQELAEGHDGQATTGKYFPD